MQSASISKAQITRQSRSSIGRGVKLAIQHLEAHVDSLLVAGQVRGDYAAKGDIMILYLEQALQLKSKFTSFNIRHINRSENKSADALSKLASTSF